MNIEESIKEIEKIKEIFIHLRNYGWINDIKKDINTDNAIQAIENLLTAYEKEKEEHKKECHNCDEYTAKIGELEVENQMLKSELEKEKEKNKTLKNLQNDTNGLYIGMIERKNYFERELQKLEDKIKAKVKEIKDRPVQDEFITATQGKLNTIIDIENLLDEEE